MRLLGVNRSGSEYACVQGWGIFDGPTDGRAIAAMASWGVNAVRIPLNEDCWLGINGVPAAYAGARYRDAVHAYARRLLRAGFYVVLDLHWSAPGSTLATGQQQMADLDHAPALWASVARAFRGDDGVVFDLYNEPHDIGWRCWRDGCVVPGGWRTAGMQELVDAVRSAGARQPLLLSGIGWGSTLASWLAYRPHDPLGQLLAGLHVYDFSGCATPSCWNGNVAAVGRRAPVVVGELGQRGCGHSFVDRFMRWADSHDVSYLAWSWNMADCSGGPSLIRSWAGAPSRYGAGVRAHLERLRDG